MAGVTECSRPVSTTMEHQHQRQFGIDLRLSKHHLGNPQPIEDKRTRSHPGCVGNVAGQRDLTAIRKNDHGFFFDEGRDG